MSLKMKDWIKNKNEKLNEGKHKKMGSMLQNNILYTI